LSLFSQPTLPCTCSLSLHDALPILMDDALGLFLPVPQFVLLAAAQVDLVVGELPAGERCAVWGGGFEVRGLMHAAPEPAIGVGRSEEHTSELQSQSKIVCRLLPEKK